MLKIVTEEIGLVDIWRMHHPNELKYTCTKTNSSLSKTTMSRIDFLLISQNLVKDVINSDISPGLLSDHSIPWLIMKTEHQARGPGFWQLNRSLLGDEDYVKAIKEIIQEEKKKSFATIFEKWMFIKARIRGYTIQYTSRKKKSRINKLKVIEKNKNIGKMNN